MGSSEGHSKVFLICLEPIESKMIYVDIFIGSSYSGITTVSKTEYVGSIPTLPAIYLYLVGINL